MLNKCYLISSINDVIGENTGKYRTNVLLLSMDLINTVRKSRNNKIDVVKVAKRRLFLMIWTLARLVDRRYRTRVATTAFSSTIIFYLQK